MTDENSSIFVELLFHLSWQSNIAPSQTDRQSKEIEALRKENKALQAQLNTLRAEMEVT